MEHFGLRGRRGSIFSKRVRNWGPTDDPKVQKTKKSGGQGTTWGICQGRMDARRYRTTLGLVLSPKNPKKNSKTSKIQKIRIFSVGPPSFPYFPFKGGPQGVPRGSAAWTQSAKSAALCLHSLTACRVPLYLKPLYLKPFYKVFCKVICKAFFLKPFVQ